MATHSNNLAWEVPWTEEPAGGGGGVQSIGSQRVGHNLPTKPPSFETVPVAHFGFSIFSESAHPGR